MNKLLEEAVQRIDDEDHEAALEELQKYLKMGRWNRITHPVFKKGFTRGMCAGIFITSIILLSMHRIFYSALCGGG